MNTKSKNTTKSTTNTADIGNYAFKTISMLPLADNIPANSLFEFSEYDSDYRIYHSKGVRYDTLQHQTFLDVEDELKQQYYLLSDMNFTNMLSSINAYLSGNTELMLSGDHNFIHPPTISVSVKEFDGDMGKFNSNKVINLESLELFNKKNNSMFLNNGGGFATNYYSIELQKSETYYGLTNAPSTETEKHNAYIFRIVGTESNTWTAPESGWFTCYGWVDEDGETHACNRWITLEGYFGTNSNNIVDSNWKVLQLQPVIKETTCTYVSFSIPVKKGLMMRLKTGFKVGTNSGLYWSQRNSMTNHIANAFVGGIYNGYYLTADTDEK